MKDGEHKPRGGKTYGDSVDPVTALERSLPSHWYLGEPIYALEREHVFMREWLCVGREEMLPGPGAHTVLDLFGESILLLRNERGELRAFYNVCVHRGARLCAAPSGENDPQAPVLGGGVIGGRVILCPYHAWSYSLDGQLQRAPHLGDAFDTSSLSLHPVGCERWGGFIFLNLSPAQAPDFKTHIKGSAALCERYPLADLQVGATLSYEVAANWKVLCENYNECYHCGPVHPELCDLVPAFRTAGGATLDWERGVAHREGAVTFTASGTSARRPFPGLNEDEQVRHKGDLLYPNLFLSLACDHVAVFYLWALDAGHTRVECQFLFEPHEMSKASFDPADAVEFWDRINRQDWAICERVQQGIGARVHRFGLFSPMEDWNLDIRRYLIDRIGPHLPPGSTVFPDDEG